jgi:uncharacterized damage-inducible protein DinB
MRATAQAKKDKVIAELVEARRKILDAAAALPLEKQDEVFLGIWSAKDLLAHLVGWDYTNLAAVEEILAGQLPSFYAHHDRDWRTYNTGLVAKYKREASVALLSLVQDSHQRLVDFLRTVPAEEFGKDRGLRFRGYKVTIARLLQAEASDEETHYKQLQHLLSPI